METAEGCWQRGEGARAAGRLAAAAADYRRVLAAEPGFMAGHANLFVVLETEDPAIAGRALARALALEPLHPLLRFNLGNLRHATRTPGAGTAFRQSLALAPGEAGAWLNLAGALHRAGWLSETARAARRVTALLQIEGAPLAAEAWIQLGNARRDQGRTDDALAAYDQALVLRPDHVDAERNRLATRLYLDDDEERSAAEAKAFVERQGPRVPLAPSLIDRDPERPLLVGLLSSDLGDHPVGRNLSGFVEHHDRSRIQLVAYDTGGRGVVDASGRGDASSLWFRSRIRLWRDVGRLEDRAIAEAVRADRIDVLVMVAGRFDRNRPLVAAWRPAPVQVAMYDGGPSGMGEGDKPAIAGWITDRWLHPEGDESAGSGDRLLRLPFYCSFRQPDWDPPAPSGDGRSLVLGSFSNPAKLSLRTLAAWAEILRRLPRARLVLKYRTWYGDPEVRARIAGAVGDEVFSRFDLAAAAEDARAHLARYAAVDLALDPFPFSGVTTSFEALAMGVPVLTLAGRAAIGRTTTAILGPLGLDELIATSHEDYVARAVDLATDRERLLALRREIPERLKASPLLDGRAHAAALGETFRRLWREHLVRKDAPTPALR